MHEDESSTLRRSDPYRGYTAGQEMPSSSVVNKLVDLKRLRIACVIASMNPGGAQRVIAQLCNHFAAQGHDVSLLILESEPASFFKLGAGVRLLPLGRHFKGHGIKRILRVAQWVLAIRRALVDMKPDIVISFIDLTNVMVLLATRGLGIPVIVSERTDPHHHPIGRIGNALRHLTYPRACRIVVQTARAARFFSRNDRSKLVVIANPVSPAAVPARPSLIGRNGRWRIIGIGRLDRPKGFGLLIRAFARLADRFREWDVVIFGEGPEREALLKAVADENLIGRVAIAEPTKAIETELAASHVFALPSRYEGFPNALAEAMSAGLPAACFSGVSGVEELIEPGRCGLLADFGANDSDAVCSLAKQLALLMESSALRECLGAAAVARTKAFAPAHLLARWDQLVADVIAETGKR